jgi:high-affinity iron transporter
MGAALLITFRETLEAALVIGITLAFLAKADLKHLKPAVWVGAAVGAAASAIAAYLFIAILGGFEGKAEQIFEGIVMLAGAILLTTLILWLNKKDMKAAMESRVMATASAGSFWGIALLAFVSVLREGIETVLFISSTLRSSGLAGFLGAAAGIVLAIALGVAFFRSGARMPLKNFFAVTNILLLLFAAGLVGQSVHELNEAGIVPPFVEQIWNLNPPSNGEAYPALHEKGAIGGFLKGLFGYNGDPSLTETAAYLAYLISIGTILLRRNNKLKSHYSR